MFTTLTPSTQLKPQQQQSKTATRTTFGKAAAQKTSSAPQVKFGGTDLGLGGGGLLNDMVDFAARKTTLLTLGPLMISGTDASAKGYMAHAINDGQGVWHRNFNAARKRVLENEDPIYLYRPFNPDSAHNTRSSLKGYNLDKITLAGFFFSECDFSHRKFKNTIFKDCSFYHSFLGNPTGATFINPIFSNTDINKKGVTIKTT